MVRPSTSKSSLDEKNKRIRRKSSLDKENKRITIGIKSQVENKKHMFSLKLDVPLRKFLMHYCESKNLDYKSTKFVYKGRKVRVNGTPEEHHMKNNDQIDALVDAHSG